MKKLIPSLILAATCSITYADNINQNIRLTDQQQTVEVSLPANATTGYQWFIKSYDHDLLSLQGYRYTKSNSNAVGSGGTAIFSFSVDPRFYDAPQMTTVSLAYQQPWSAAQSGSTATITISATSSSNDDMSWQKYPDITDTPQPQAHPANSTDVQNNWISLPTSTNS